MDLKSHQLQKTLTILHLLGCFFLCNTILYTFYRLSLPVLLSIGSITVLIRVYLLRTVHAESDQEKCWMRANAADCSKKTASSHRFSQLQRAEGEVLLSETAQQNDFTLNSSGVNSSPFWPHVRITGDGERITRGAQRLQAAVFCLCTVNMKSLKQIFQLRSALCGWRNQTDRFHSEVLVGINETSVANCRCWTGLGFEWEVVMRRKSGSFLPFYISFISRRSENVAVFDWWGSIALHIFNLCWSEMLIETVNMWWWR